MSAAELFRAWNAPQFKGLAHISLDGLLNLLDLLLGVQESPGDGVAEECLTILLEFSNLLSSQLNGVLLLVLQCLAFAHERLILSARFCVIHERVNALTHGLDARLIQNILA